MLRINHMTLQSAIDLPEPTLADAHEAIDYGTMIGAGAFRSVYRYGNDPWVYKVNHDVNSRSGNAQEFATYEFFTALNILPENVRLPKMVLLGDILAAEFIEGRQPEDCYPAYTGNRWKYDAYHEPDCLGVDKCWAHIVGSTNIKDVHSYNVVQTETGTVYLVDLGNGSDATKA